MNGARRPIAIFGAILVVLAIALIVGAAITSGSDDPKTDAATATSEDCQEELAALNEANDILAKTGTHAAAQQRELARTALNECRNVKPKATDPPTTEAPEATAPEPTEPAGTEPPATEAPAEEEGDEISDVDLALAEAMDELGEELTITAADLMDPEVRELAECKEDLFLTHSLAGVEKGNPKKRQDSDSVSIPYQFTEVDGMMAETRTEICQNVVFLDMVIRGLHDSELSFNGKLLRELNPWMGEWLELAGTNMEWFATPEDLLRLVEEDGERVLYVRPEVQDVYAMRVIALLSKAQVVGIVPDLLTSVNWHLPVLEGELPRTVKNERQYVGRFLVLQFSAKGFGCVDAFGFNAGTLDNPLGDKRFARFTCEVVTPPPPPVETPTTTTGGPTTTSPNTTAPTTTVPTTGTTTTTTTTVPTGTTTTTTTPTTTTGPTTTVPNCTGNKVLKLVDGVWRCAEPPNTLPAPTTTQAPAVTTTQAPVVSVQTPTTTTEPAEVPAPTTAPPVVTVDV